MTPRVCEEENVCRIPRGQRMVARKYPSYTHEILRKTVKLHTITTLLTDTHLVPL